MLYSSHNVHILIVRGDNMRKSPTFNHTIICKMCGKEIVPTSSRQIYCKECSEIANAERKRKHYQKNNPNAYQEREQKYCIVCGNKFSASFNGEPYCNKHYLRMLTNGTTDYIGRKSKNTYVKYDDYVALKTTKGIEFLIDNEDFEKVIKYTWCVSKTGYLVANIHNKVTKLHRYILDLKENDKVVDHINHNKLDNRKNNLRVCSQIDNSRNLPQKKTNTSGFTGVRLLKNGKYKARIMYNRKEIHLGH